MSLGIRWLRFTAGVALLVAGLVMLLLSLRSDDGSQATLPRS